MSVHRLVALIALAQSGFVGAQIENAPGSAPRPQWADLYGQKGVEPQGSVATASDALEIAAWWGDARAGYRNYAEREAQIISKARDQMAANPNAPGALVTIERHGQGMGAVDYVDYGGSGELSEAIANLANGKITETRPGAVSSFYGVYVDRNMKKTIVSGARLGNAPELSRILRQETKEFEERDRKMAARERESKSAAERSAIQQERATERREHGERTERVARIVELRQKGENTTDQEQAELARFAEEAERRRNVGRILADDDRGEAPLPEWAEGLSPAQLRDPYNIIAIAEHYKEKSPKINPRAPYLKGSDLMNFRQRYDITVSAGGIELSPVGGARAPIDR